MLAGLGGVGFACVCMGGRQKDVLLLSPLAVAIVGGPLREGKFARVFARFFLFLRTDRYY